MNTFMSVTTCLFCSINKKLIIVFININKHLKLFLSMQNMKILWNWLQEDFNLCPRTGGIRYSKP